MKRQKGFTLIELLIVVAIIGILAALLIPNIMTAMQKAKQKSTMKSINTIATALVNYATDNGQVPAFGAQLADANDAFLDNITPFYIQTSPWCDEWGHGFYIYTQAAVAGSGFKATIPSAELGSDSFLVGSSGRNDGINDVTGTYAEATPEGGLYTVSSMADFNNELVMYNGSWIIGPRTRGGALAGT